MSCLYSSPEVISLTSFAFAVPAFAIPASAVSSLQCHGDPLRRASRTPDRGAVQFHTDFAVTCGRQRRAPQQPDGWRRLHQIISPAKTSTGFSRDFSSAISGFRSLCGRKQRSSLSHRAQLDLRFGTFHSGRALALRTLASTRISLRGIYGASNPGPMLWQERSRSGGIFQVVFLPSNQAL